MTNHTTEGPTIVALVDRPVKIGIQRVDSGEYPVTEIHDDGFIALQVGGWSHCLTSFLQHWYGVSVASRWPMGG